MKKKWIAWTLLAALSVSAFAGCGSSQTSGTGTESGSSSGGSSSGGSSSAETGSGSVEVEFWYAGGKTAAGVIQEIVDSFNASQSKYHVSTVVQADYGETYQKLQAGLAGNAAPDLALLEISAGRSLNKKGLLANMQPMIDADSAFVPEDYLSVFYNQGMDAEGKVFGIPAYGTTQVMYYNKAAFEAAGVKAEEIKTWDDLSKAAKKIKDAGYNYGWEPMWGADNLMDAALCNGASVFSEDGTKVMINSPEWVDVWESIRTWIHEDKTMAIHSGGQGWEYWYATIDDVIAGKAGGYTGSSGDQADLDFNIVAAMEQPAFHANTTSAPVAPALLMSIIGSAPTEEQQGAFEFIKYFTSADSQVKWTMSTGYVAVNQKINDNTEYQAYVEKNPQAAVPFAQAMHATVPYDDPTNGAVMDAMRIAADKVEIEGIDAKTALDEAQATAQAALDEALGQ